MALATNTTLGSVVLGGDLTGSAFSPSLRPTGAIPGTYQVGNCVIDAKGRLIYVITTPYSSIEPYMSVGSASVYGMIKIGSGPLTGDGLSVSGGLLTLDVPDASATTKGATQPGNGFSLTSAVISANVGTGGAKGIIQVGDNIDVSGGIISIKTATTGALGLVATGTGVVNTSGTISVTTATNAIKGIVQVGSSMSVSGGVLDIADATTSAKGLVNIGAGFTITGSTLSFAPPATTTGSKGVVQIGSGFSVSSGNVSANIASSSVKGIAQAGAEITVIGGVLSIDTAVSDLFIKKNITNTVTASQHYAPTILSGSPISWDGLTANLFTVSMSGAITLNNGTNIQAGAYYNFIITQSAGDNTITYGNSFLFKPGCARQPVGSKSVLSCYAVSSTVLYCVMQPNFI